MNYLKSIRLFFKYYLSAVTSHDVHSPFLFQFISEVLDTSRHYYPYDQIEKIREHLLANEDEIDYQDFGAGSKTSHGSKRTIASIAKLSATTKRDGRILFNLIVHFGSKHILELGTSLGIGTMYLASANPRASFTTLEGNPGSAKIAKQNFNEMSLDNIHLHVGRFQDTLPLVLNLDSKFDLVFIDGNHQKTATLEYFNLILPYLTEKAIVVLDDIYWSEGMVEAFSALKNHPSVCTYIDIYSKGFLFLDPALRGINGMTWIKSTYKPWRLGIWGGKL